MNIRSLQCLKHYAKEAHFEKKADSWLSPKLYNEANGFGSRLQHSFKVVSGVSYLMDVPVRHPYQTSKKPQQVFFFVVVVL